MYGLMSITKYFHAKNACSPAYSEGIATQKGSHMQIDPFENPVTHEG